jgi:AbiV family abortive infection protein
MDLELVQEDEIKKGLLMTISNSNSLIEDGRLLFANQRYPRAFTMFQFASEELGKALILFDILLTRKLNRKIDYKIRSLELTSHQVKHRYSVGIEFTAISMIYSDPPGNVKEILKSVVKKLQSSKIYNNLKNNSIYVNLENNKFKIPEDYIGKDIVESIENDVDLRFQLYTGDINERLQMIDEIALKYIDFENNPDFDKKFIDDLRQIIER